MARFHKLVVKDVRKETAECVSVAFDIPDHLLQQFRFEAGQNVTVKLEINGAEVRRSYSICSSPRDNEVRIAVKKISEGVFSSYANSMLKVGDVLEVLPPTGRFCNKSHLRKPGNYLAFAAGSGITPVISIISDTLASEPESTFMLIYGNRTRNSIIFKEQLGALKNKYIERFVIHHVLSREQMDAPVYNGRIDREKCELMSKFLFDPAQMDHIFICGPEQMIFTIRDWLLTRKIGVERIHYELFTVPGEEMQRQRSEISSVKEETSTIKVKLDGITITYQLPFYGNTILDGGLQQGADLPYACKGGVCATCRALLIKGRVEMDTNYALEEDELESGYILTCQSHPRTGEVEVDFDAKW